MTQSNFGMGRAGWCAFALPLALALAANGCNSEERVMLGQPPGAEGEQQLLGALRLPLVTPDAGKFRLRGAVFEIARSGVPIVSLNSDDEPDAEVLTADLEPGQYTSTLGNGWSLEQLAADGSATPVRAALISANPARFSVSNARATTVAYSFTTGSGIVSFGEGSVNVRIGVSDPATLASCDVAVAGSCPGGQHCLIGDGGSSYCATPGDLPVGAACNSEQCVVGAQCLSLDPAAPEQGVCTTLCNPEFPAFGCDCRGLSISETIGVCGPPPPNACDLLDPASCPAGKACQFPGGSFGVCGTPGNVPEGGSCFGEQCEAGLSCEGDDPNFGSLGVCRRFCNLDAPDCDFCFDVGTGRVGRCFL